MITRFGRLLPVGPLLLVALVFTASAVGASPGKRGGWLEERDEKANVLVLTMEMALHPKPEPRPALTYRLLPDDFDMLEGNAAIYYLKAMGFLEQNAPRNRLREVYEEAEKRARKEGKSSSDVPLHVWLSVAPKDLPVKEVREFLDLTSFQPRFLKEAARRRGFDLERNLREIEDPFSYLLPEVQSMKELARMQSLRCKLAIAEGRMDDAIAILGQQYAAARHLGKDEFLVSNLVGIAVAGIAFDDALHLVQHPDTPNLYWAFATLPRPLVDTRHALAVERQLLYLQFKALRELDESPRSTGYWQEFLDRVIGQVGDLATEFGLPWAQKDPELARAVLVGFVAAAYPGAKRYLIQECRLPREKVEQYPIAQVVALAIVRYFDEARDDIFKWSYLPYWQASGKIRGHRIDEMVRVKPDRVGPAATPVSLLMPAILAVGRSVAWLEQGLALVQTVEAIRMYGAAHGGKLPPTLDDLPVPAPLDPVAGRPLNYECRGAQAALTGHDAPGLRLRLVLRFVESVDQPTGTAHTKEGAASE